MVIFLFLTHDETRKLSNSYKVKLHNPVEDITLDCSMLRGQKYISMRDYFILQETHCLLATAVINKKCDPTFNIDRIKSK